MTMDANQSVARALKILETLAAAGAPQGVRDVARSLGVSPSIAQRLLATLAEHGFAEQDGSRKYGVGLRAFAVGNTFVGGNALAREALDELQALSERHRLNTYLGVLRNRSVVYLLACQSSGPIAIRTAAGAETHLHSTALGKALLCAMDDAAARKLLGREPYARLTLHTKARFAALVPDLQEGRRLGYVVSDEENLVGVYALGAAIRDAQGRVVAAISGALPRHDVTKAALPQLQRLVVGAAERISRRLGAAPSRRAA
jgi:DNA-binding IclR family transcriptional regulator